MSENAAEYPMPVEWLILAQKKQATEKSAEKAENTR